MNRLSKLALACALAFSVTQALAASNASANLAEVNFTLIDLMPDDGIAPSFTILYPNGATRLSVGADDYSTGDKQADGTDHPGTFTYQGSLLAELLNGRAFAASGTSQLTAQGAANGGLTYFSASASTGVVGSDYGISMLLSAHSVLQIDAKVNLAASASNAPGCTSCSPTENASAAARLALFYSYYDPSTYSSPYFNEVRTEQINARASLGHDESVSFQDSWRVVFNNTTNSQLAGVLGLHVYVSGGGTTPVPEPETWGLGLAGLASAGYVLSRRRSRQV